MSRVHGCPQRPQLKVVVHSQMWVLSTELRTSEEQQLFLNTEHLSNPKF